MKRRMVMKKYLIMIFTVLLVSCGKRELPTALLPPPPLLPPEPEIAVAVEEHETLTEIPADETIIEEGLPARIIVPYTREYLSPGQETKITVRLENGEYGDEMYFVFATEQGKHSIEVEGNRNVAVIKAVGEGEQYMRISHPKAQESRVIVFDVLPPAPPPPPEIDVSESPMIIGKNETRQLRVMLVNGKSGGNEQFEFRVVENAYAIAVEQNGNLLDVTGIAPGAGKIRIHNPAALRDYDVMVIVH